MHGKTTIKKHNNINIATSVNKKETVDVFD
jgi:hypothetical protein